MTVLQELHRSAAGIASYCRHDSETKAVGATFFLQTQIPTFTQISQSKLHVCMDAERYAHRAPLALNMEAFGQHCKQNIALNKGNNQAFSTYLNPPRPSLAKQCAPNQHSS